MADASLSFNILTKYQDAGVNRAEKDMRKFGATTQRTSGNMKRFAAVGAAALATGAVLAGKALVGMTQNAAADEAAQRKLATAMRNTVGATDSQVASVESWITAQGKALGVTDDELRPAFQRLVSATGSVTEAQNQMKIAMDVSAGTGKSLEVVSAALMKANNGTTASLSKLGLKTKDANGDTMSLDAALKSMSETYRGQAAGAANTLDGKMARLQIRYDEAKEAIGARLIPVATRLSDWMLTKGVPAASELGNKFGQIAAFVRDNSSALVALTGVIVAVTAVTKLHAAVLAVQAAGGLLKYLAATKLVTIATTAWTAVQWAINAALTANPIGIVVVAIAALVTGLVIAYKKSETFRKIVDGAFGAVKKAAMTAFGWVKSNWPLLLAIITGPIGLAVLAITKNWDKIKEGLVKVKGWFEALPGKIVGALASIADVVKTVGHNIIQGMINGVRERVSSLVSAARDAVSAAIKAAKDKLGISSPSKVFMKIGEQTVDGLLEGLEKRRSKLRDKVASLMQASKDVASNFRSSFSSSVFGADMSGPDGTGTASVGGILEFQREQASKAAALKSNVKSLIAKGLSKDLIKQLVAQGASGEAQIAALAGGSKAEIAELNSLNKATSSSLASAGGAVGNALYGDSIRAARKEVRQVNYVINITGALDKNATAKEIRQLLLELKRKERIDLGLA